MGVLKGCWICGLLIFVGSGKKGFVIGLAYKEMW